MFRNTLKVISFSCAFALATAPANAETIFGAMASAYGYNANLNSARAGVRVADENIPIAKGGMRPQISATSSLAGVAQRQETSSAGATTTRDSDTLSIDFGVQINQTLFDGFQTRNNVRSAESNVYASQANLVNTEQNTLFNAGTAYMDVLRDRQLVNLRTRNLEFLREQVRSARARFDVGESTRTDVSQAQASLSQAQALLYLARSNLAVSEATYRQVVGRMPGDLRPTSPLTKNLPGSLNTAMAIALNNHPAIQANRHLVDASSFTVKSREGAFMPQVGATASIEQGFSDTSIDGPAPSSSTDTLTATIGAQVTVPIYQGGIASAQTRQAKEQLSQARINVDVTIDQVRANVIAAWNQYVAAREAITAGLDLIGAQTLALNGVIEERNVGQRTTLDVLDAQSALITAQVTQVGAERDAVVASLGILSATGRLTADSLGLGVKRHDPDEHLEAVEDAWYGLRTPDGR
ncbi:TolC family outer membrane protein [Notoacmeibacter ruber]|uniref:TolC family outer membrane protein n=1 Tax=Notoacmeibacter ruber TaxID=2670375 RepID=UPI001FE07BEF|nr:TolC family outer membrane protein [Notoacmeibacter ruber]